MSGWGCPHEIGGRCTRIKGFECDPGMKGCVLFGRFRFSNENKNRSPKPRRTVDRQPDEGAHDDHQPAAKKPTPPNSR